VFNKLGQTFWSFWSTAPSKKLLEILSRVIW